jgi:hypothetical protein
MEPAVGASTVPAETVKNARINMSNNTPASDEGNHSTAIDATRTEAAPQQHPLRQLQERTAERRRTPPPPSPQLLRLQTRLSFRRSRCCSRRTAQRGRSTSPPAHSRWTPLKRRCAASSHLRCRRVLWGRARAAFVKNLRQWVDETGVCPPPPGHYPGYAVKRAGAH